MQFITDSFSLTGAQHIPKGLGCQDYTTSGVLDNAAYAVICDGSSCADAKTGEPDRHAKTSVGASTLALITARAIADNWAETGLVDVDKAPEVIRLTHKLALPMARRNLGLNIKDMAATCAYAYVSPEGGYVHILGDGVLCLRKTDGSIYLLRWDWDGNAPFYPSYAEGVLPSFTKDKGGLQAKALTEQEWLIESKNAVPEDLGVRKYTVAEGIEGVVVTISAEEMAEMESIILFSDGIGSVCKGSPMNPEVLDWKQMVARMVNLIGAPLPNFAMVRLDRWQQRDTTFLEAVHFDDLSIAAIRIIHDGQ